jgi:hypothetical protein
MKCDFVVSPCGEMFVAECRRCGARVNVPSSSTPIAKCRPRPGLGDMVAAGLSAVGITPERVSAVIGGPCGCEQRKEALNDWGRDHLGIG